jgi:hypothetical protein
MTDGLVPVPTADWTNSLADFAAKAVHGEQKNYLLLENIFQLDPGALVERDFGFSRIDGDFIFLFVDD